MERVAHDSRFSIFNIPQVDFSTSSIHYVEFRPTTPIKQYQSLDIVVPATSLYYIDLSGSTLCVKFTIRRDDNLLVEPKDHVGTINFPVAVFFSNWC